MSRHASRQKLALDFKIRCGRPCTPPAPGGNVGFVGVPHEVAIDGGELIFSHVGLRGGPARCAATCPT